MFLVGIHYASRRLLENPRKTTTKVAGVLLLWLGFLSLVVASGVLEKFVTLGLPLFFISIIAVVLWFSFSHWGAKIALTVPIAFLVGFQLFRLPLELILDLWVQQGTIPATMTWTGKNLDVLTGLLALIVAPITGRYRLVAWAFNIVGLVLLVNVIRVAIMSSSLPFGWGVEPTLQLAFHLPYALIGPVCIGGALAGHVILTRALLYH